MLIPSLLRPSKSCHGAQGVEFVGRSQRVGPNHSRAATPFSMVAQVFRAETDDWEVAEPSEPTSQSANDAPSGLSGTISSARFCKEQDRPVRTCIGSDGGHWRGLAVQANKLELEEGQNSFQKPPLNVFFFLARKFIVRSMRTSEGDGGRTSGGGTFVVGGTRESQEDVDGAGEGSQPPSTVTGRNFTDHRPPTGGEHVAGRTELQSRGGVAISRGGWRSCTLHRVQKRQPRTSENEQPKDKCVVQRTSRILEQELTDCMCTKHFDLRDALEIGPNELVVEISQLLAKGALAIQAFSVRPSTLSNMVT